MLSFSMSVSNARSVGANNVNMLPPVLAHSNISVRLAAARAVAMAANASLEDRTSITEGGNMTSPKVCTIPLLALVSASKISTVLTRTSGPSAFTTMFAPNSDMISPVTKSSAIIRPGTRWYFKISGRSARAKTPARSSSPSAVTAASKAALFGAKTVHLAGRNVLASALHSKRSMLQVCCRPPGPCDPRHRSQATRHPTRLPALAQANSSALDSALSGEILVCAVQEIRQIRGIQRRHEVGQPFLRCDLHDGHSHRHEHTFDLVDHSVAGRDVHGSEHLPVHRPAALDRRHGDPGCGVEGGDLSAV
mmetsp:Transcript_81687/g.218630  ORF Transcript_81687/g.218630 Transcript_81687/m.218630 type:complete len:307 (-) Transcript_81687:3296-4216(-)